MNKIQSAILWGQADNLMSVPTDCDQRDERKGWMGDAQLTSNEALYNYDIVSFYQSWLLDIADAQSSDGSVPDTTPLTFGSQQGDPSWGSAYPTIVQRLYQHYGTIDTINLHINNLESWVQHLNN